MTGIGFLGAGAIIRQGLSVRGLTTAATFWLVAAIGMAAGAGYYAGAVIATRRRAAHPLPAARSSRTGSSSATGREVDRLVVEIPAGGSPAPLIDAIERLGARRRRSRSRRRATGARSALDVDCAGDAAARSWPRVAEIEGVLEVRWTRLSATLCSRNAHKARELARVLPGWTIEPLEADDCPRRPARRTTRTRARRRAFGRDAGSAGWMLGEDSGIEVDGARRPPGISRRGTGRRARRRSGSCSASSRAPTTERRATSPSSSRSRPTAASFAGAATLDGTIAEGRAARGLRLRPGVRAGGRGADGGRARRRVEGPRLAPRAGRAGAARGARRGVVLAAAGCGGTRPTRGRC